jgi:hypothetical protein
MIQLSYEPAYDVFHCTFRMLRLRSFIDASARKPKEYYRILDFFMLFPEQLSHVRFKNEHRRLRSQVKSIGTRPSYGRKPESLLLLDRMRPFQEAAMRALAERSFIEREAFDDGWFTKTRKPLPRELEFRVLERNTNEKDLISILRMLLEQYDLNGEGGLKARTGLMDHTYDIA